MLGLFLFVGWGKELSGELCDSFDCKPIFGSEVGGELYEPTSEGFGFISQRFADERSYLFVVAHFAEHFAVAIKQPFGIYIERGDDVIDE